jgi:hypothetical protein
MKVIKRSQVTEVVTKRQVSHELKLGNSTFIRYEQTTIRIPYMDCEIVVNEPIITWNIKTSTNTVRSLSKKEIFTLKLNDLFNKIDINSKNGN